MTVLKSEQQPPQPDTEAGGEATADNEAGRTSAGRKSCAKSTKKAAAGLWV